PGLADSPWATCCRPLRGLVLLRLLRTQGSRTRPGLHAVARYAGSCSSAYCVPRARGLAQGYMLSPATRARAPPLTAYPGLADSPWAVARYAGSCSSAYCVPRARGLALGYMLSPATRARALRLLRTPGSRTRPWATC